MDLLPADVTPIIFLREPVARTISHLNPHSPDKVAVFSGLAQNLI
jgi:hypothetical protein